MSLVRRAVRKARREARAVVDRAQGLPPGAVPLRPFTPQVPGRPGLRRCAVCRWQGAAFTGGNHCEASVCPGCGAIGRDRWLFHCLTTSVAGIGKQTRLLETSPRLGDSYKDAMAARVDYLASDYDQRAHKADIALDLQKIDLPDASLDVVMTSHVLEHVPDTSAALNELMRVLKPGGSVILLVPVLQGATAPPAEPEFHGDDTPVFWRFGLDLTGTLRAHGFETRLLCTADFRRHADAGDPTWPDGISPEWDVASIVAATDPNELTVICDDRLADTLGLVPSYMYLGWHARKPG
ncbi:MAG TPA: methyltransferase domain-containing protein [Frankiaceae bacterium]|nr:methyltransferase domain-containing protein [Frankiaceae bacterium]